MAFRILAHARLGVPLAACVAAVAALSLGLRNESVVDAALPLYAAAVGAIAWLEGRRCGDATVAFAIPLLGVWRVGVPDEHLRLLLYGLTLSLSAAIFASRTLGRGERLRLGETLVLVTSCVAAMRLVPFDAESLPAQALVVACTVALTLSLEGRDGIGAGALFACLAAGLATPAEPMKAALFPLLVAAVLAVVRGPSPFSAGAIVGIALVSGRWAWPLAGLTLASVVLAELVEPLLERRRGAASAAIGIAPFDVLPLASGAVAAITFSPESLLRLPSLLRPARITAVALAVAALVLRPSLGALYLIAAFAVLLTADSVSVGRTDAVTGPRRAVPVVAISVSMAMLALAGFSGSIVSRFPLPLSLGELAAVALVGLAVMPARRWPLLGTVLSVSVFVGALAFGAWDGKHEAIEARAVLVAGETFEVAVPAGDELLVELSGGNLTALEPGVPLGAIEAIDRAGRVTRREIVVGDLADWGLGRPGHYFAARNEWPAFTQAKVAEYGSRAFLGGSGSVRVGMPGIELVRVTASGALPERGRLNIESVSVVRR